MPSFDVVSEVDHQEVRNAVDQAQRELSTRFDFKNTNSTIEQNDLALTLRSSSEDRLRALRQVLEERLVKRGVSLKGLDYGKVEEAASSTVRQTATITVGISSDKAREINRMIKDKGPKGVSSQTQGDQVRVTGKKRDDLQSVIAAPQGGRPRHPPPVHQLPGLSLVARPWRAPTRFARQCVGHRCGALGSSPDAPSQLVTSLVAKLAQAAAEEDDEVDGLEGDAALDAAPQDRVSEEVDEGQPVVRRQVGLDGLGGVDQVEHLRGDEGGKGAERGGQRRVRPGRGEQARCRPGPASTSRCRGWPGRCGRAPPWWSGRCPTARSAA